MAVAAKQKEVPIKTEEEIELIRQSSLLVAKTHGLVSKMIQPGVNTLKLDQAAEEFIRDHGGIPAFKNYRTSMDTMPFPFSLCISVNEEVVHGLAGAHKNLEDGDIVSIDCGVLMNDYYGDSAYTYPVGEISAKKRKLLRVTKESLYKGLEKAVAGNRLGDISHAIQYHAESHGFSVVREMVGHGVGKRLHEPPEIPNYGRKRTGIQLQEGMVFAIEPMINMGKKRIKFLDDGWTIVTSDGNPSAHFEHTVAIREGKVEILSSFDFIEEN